MQLTPEQQSQIKYKCLITFNGFDWRNDMTVKSPSGKKISLKAFFNYEMSEEVVEMFTYMSNAWETAKYGQGTQECTYDLSREAMQQLLEISQGVRPEKTKKQ